MMKLHANVLKFSYFFYRIIDRITEFSFIIFSDFIHFIKCFILSTMNYHLFFFHCYQLYIAFYYSYVNPLTINSCDARGNNLVCSNVICSQEIHEFQVHVSRVTGKKR